MVENRVLLRPPYTPAQLNPYCYLNVSPFLNLSIFLSFSVIFLHLLLYVLIAAFNLSFT